MAVDLDFAGAVAALISAGIAQAEHVERVERLAYTDPLTGLGNRRTFDDALDRAVAQHVADGVDVGLVFADVNGLKQVNDEHGHAHGDQALVALAAVLARAAAALDHCTAARLGGDEFCLLVTGLPSDRVVAAAEALCRDAADVLPLGVACGVVCTADIPTPVSEPTSLLRLADAAQFRAKRAGLRTPVVAGRHLSQEAVSAARRSAERRRIRSVGVDLIAISEIGLAALDGATGLPPAPRLAALAEALGPAVDAAAWWLSEIPEGSGRIYTRDSRVYRESEGRRPEFFALYDLEAWHPVEAFPATDEASRGQRAVIADASTGEGDPAELTVLALEGCRALVMAGGGDGAGSRWVLEIHADDLGVPVASYAQVLRLLVAAALVAARPQRRSPGS